MMATSVFSFILGKVASVFIAFMFSFTAFVFYQSFWEHSKPMTVGVQNIQVKRDSHGILLTWECSTKIHRKFSGHIRRSLFKEGGEELISLPQSEFTFSPDDKIIPTKSIMLPSSITPGRWCMKSQVDWTEFLSLRESHMEGMNVCFDVPLPAITTHDQLVHRVKELEKFIEEHTAADFKQHAELLKKQ